MAINNQPTIKPRTVTGMFTKYIAKTLPLAFDESMSYYECLCALLEYLNETIVPDINNTNEGLEELQGFYTDLQNYVNNYFDNLDVQEEINNKLDKMTQDGTLTDLIANYVNPVIDNFREDINTQIRGQNSEIAQIDAKVDGVASGSPLVASSTSEMTQTNRIYVNTTNGYWYYYNGSEWTQGGVYQSTTVNPNDPIISKLTENVDDLENCFEISVGKNKFDGLIRVGGYNTTTGAYDGTNQNIQCNVNPVKVKPNTTYFVSDNGSSKNVLCFYYQTDGTFISYESARNTFTTPNNCGLFNFYAGTLSNNIMVSETSDLTYEEYKQTYKLNVFPANCFDTTTGKNKFNGLTRTGGYNTTDGKYDSSNQGVRSNVNPVSVKPNTKYYASNNGNAINVIQFFYDINGNFIKWGGGANNFTTPNDCYYLNFYSSSVTDKTMISESNDLTYEKYKTIYLSNTNPNDDVLNYISQHTKIMPKSNYKIINMGDSLYGNFNDETSISAIINDLIGATTYNCGFGGCRMTHRTDDVRWNAFSMCSLAYSIANNDWTAQDSAIANPPSGMPDYFSDHLSTLKSIDFTDIDILTIGYGVNDYMSRIQVDDPNDPYNTDYVTGALRYSIKTIQERYPNLCIVVISPNFAVWFSGNEVIRTSDEPYKNIGTITLPDVVNAEKDVAKELKCKFINVYDNSGNNRYTALNYFNTTDGVHPNVNGRLKMGTYIAYNLLDQ